MEKNLFITSDLSLAAYLVINGLTLERAKKLPSGKFELVLCDYDNCSEKLSLAYVNSDFSKFDSAIRTIKKILYTK